MPDLRVTKVGMQVLSEMPETLRVTKVGMQVLSTMTQELFVTKVGMQVLSSVEEIRTTRPRRSVVVVGG